MRFIGAYKANSQPCAHLQTLQLDMETVQPANAFFNTLCVNLCPDATHLNVSSSRPARMSRSVCAARGAKKASRGVRMCSSSLRDLGHSWGLSAGLSSQRAASACSSLACRAAQQVCVRHLCATQR